MNPQAGVIDQAEADVPLEYLEREICQLAANIAAATCPWLLLVAEFDRREGWAGWGLRSCAQWLNWRCGIGLVAAREHLRVAHRLGELPVVQTAFAAGELSFSKVRAITRMATGATEAELVDLARHATASHLERLARAYRDVARQDPAEESDDLHERRYLRYCWDDDGSLVIAARLSPDEGAIVIQALDAARDALAAKHRAAKEADASAEARPEEGDSDASAEARPTAADALVAMAETLLEHGPQARDGGERYQAVVIVDAKVLAGGGPGRCELEDGPALKTETARRLSCDASLVMALLGDGGEPLNLGRKTRSIPPSIRRALGLRDGQCRFPGCTQRRFVDGHHILHWSKGGETSLANLVLLCRFHHRKVHEGGYGIERSGGGRFCFTRPNGETIPEVPGPSPALPGDVVDANCRRGLTVGPDTGRCMWGGERLDLGLAIDGLLSLEGRNLN